MSNSIVRVRENPVDDSLILIIGEDGVIRPDKETVQEYLKSRSETDLKIMQVNKSDGRLVDVTVDHMTYVATQREEVMYEKTKEELEVLAKSLFNFRLDHDYTPFIHSPPPPDLPEIDELDQTLSLLEGDSGLGPSPPELVPININPPPRLSPPKIRTPPPPLTLFNKKAPIVKSINPPQTIAPVPSTPTIVQKSVSKTTKPAKLIEPIKVKRNIAHAEPLKPIEPVKDIEPSKPPAHHHPKIVPAVKTAISLLPQQTPLKLGKHKKLTKASTDIEDDDEDDVSDSAGKPDTHEDEPYSDVDFNIESEESVDDANDSDFELDEAPPKTRTRRVKKKPHSKSLSERTKSSKSESLSIVKQKVDNSNPPPKVEELQPQPTPATAPPETPPEKPPEKKAAKKDKKPPKPLPNDFMLFSTPDIIRRVGGKQQDGATPTTPNTPPVSETPHNSKVQEIVNKPEHISSETKEKRVSVDKPPRRTSVENKIKARRSSLELKRQKSVEIKPDKIRRSSSDRRRSTSKVLGIIETPSTTHTDGTPSAKDIRAIIQNENTKTFTSDLVIPDTTTNSTNIGKSEDDEELNLTIDSIDEILYKVAETLADDKEFQSALDKSLDENMLNTTIPNDALPSTTYNEANQVTQVHSTQIIVKGTQVVRPDGRVVVIPPIERPTTRSRNKVKNEPSANKTVRTTPKALDDEHVSGGELDSTSDDEDDRSDDDPEKLWCICNQPHNNRFMICCDNCEEWYHGKCVNVTKQMGQMMEKEGKEWICLYCKDLTLKRPAAAARRVRKASRNSGTDSTDHSNSNPENKLNNPSSGNRPKVQGCIVCGKPCRNHSIFCSDACIVQNAKDVEKVVVFERSTGKLLSGNDAPTVANLDKWLKKHPGFEVVRSKANIVKPAATLIKNQNMKLQVVKDPLHQGVSLALQKRGVHVGLLKHTPKEAAEHKELPHSMKVQSIQPKPTPKVVPETKVVKKSQPVKVTQLSQMVLNPAPISSSKKRLSVSSKSSSVDSNQQTPKELLKKKPPKPKPASSPVSPEKKQENVRDSVKKSLGEQLMQRIQSQSEIKLNKDEVAKITNEIESQLFKCFGDTGQKYRNKYRSLIFNIKDVKNQTLWRSICQKTVNPYQLVRLSPDDLASQELALWRERENKHQLDMITKNELDQLGRTQQFVIKTHKGEQEVEDNRLSTAIDKTEMVTGLTTDSPAQDTDSIDKTKPKTKEKDKKRNRSDRDKKYDKSNRDRDKNVRKDHNRNKQSSSRDRSARKRSRSRAASRHIEKHRSRSRDRHRRSTHKISRSKQSPPHSTTDKLDKKSKEILENLVDNKIVPPLEDKLWKHVTQEDITTAPLAESDSDHEPSSTVTIPTPPHASDHEGLNTAAEHPLNTTSREDSQIYPDDEGGTSPPPKSREIVWSGTINMIDVAEITITAHEVSGDCTGLGDELPPCLDVVGRISPETVWDYISKMKSSNSKAIALLRLNSTSVEAQMPYIALYSYLQSRNRLGVVKSYNKAVKDFYILPLASHMPIPQALLPLSGPSFEESRPVLLLGIIVRDKRKRPLFVSSTPVISKRYKIDKPATPPIVHTTGRSYTPPPAPDLPYKASPPVLAKPVTPPTPKEAEEDMDEPYSPKDSDPDTLPGSGEEESKSSTHLSSSDLTNILSGPVKSSSFLESKFIEPFTNKFDAIPGLDANSGILEKQQLQREMEALDQQIAKQKAEIQNMSQNIASTSATRVGGTLSNIELPSNIQQILDSIKTPQSTNNTLEEQVQQQPTSSTSDLTIPLMLPKISARNSSSSSSSPTIPLNLPRFKNKGSSNNSPSRTDNTRIDSYSKRTTDRSSSSNSSNSTSVLSSLSDDELIRKANEMMKTVDVPVPPFKQRVHGALSTPYIPQPPLPVKSTTSSRVESNQPPIPGLD